LEPNVSVDRSEALPCGARHNPMRKLYPWQDIFPAIAASQALVGL
jgi:hypothetical protein